MEGDRTMKHSENLARAIEEATRQARSAYEMNDKSLSRIPRLQVACGFLQHSLDVADATIILVDKGLPCPALALARPLME